MSHLSSDVKESILKKALSPNSKSIKQIAQENGVGYSTIHRWLRNHSRKSASNNTCHSNDSCHNISKEKQLEHISLTMKLNKAEIGSYCRTNGIYSHQLEQWKELFMTKSSQQEKKLLNELKGLKAENKRVRVVNHT